MTKRTFWITVAVVLITGCVVQCAALFLVPLGRQVRHELAYPAWRDVPATAALSQPTTSEPSAGPGAAQAQAWAAAQPQAAQGRTAFQPAQDAPQGGAAAQGYRGPSADQPALQAQPVPHAPPLPVADPEPAPAAGNQVRSLYPGVAVRVIDGDTIDARITLGFDVEVRTHCRLLGIDAWETRGEEREKGLLAKNRLMELLGTTPFTVIGGNARDKYGRWLIEIRLINGSDPVAVLLGEGHGH